MTLLRKIFGPSAKPDARTETSKSLPIASGENVDAEAIVLAKEYMRKDYPVGPMDQMLAELGGSSLKKPAYSVSAAGEVQRASESLAGMGSSIDMKIVQVASCLKHLGNVNMFDASAIARAAFTAVKHYAALPEVRSFFSAPFKSQNGESRRGTRESAQNECQILAGVEILLLEIYEDLPYDGSVITDKLVVDKVKELSRSM